jgi:hypothetical protein
MKEKTELGRSINVRLTQSEFDTYQKLGGIKWIRAFLRMTASIQKEIKGDKKT